MPRDNEANEDNPTDPPPAQGYSSAYSGDREQTTQICWLYSQLGIACSPLLAGFSEMVKVINGERW